MKIVSSSEFAETTRSTQVAFALITIYLGCILPIFHDPIHEEFNVGVNSRFLGSGASVAPGNNSDQSGKVTLDFDNWAARIPLTSISASFPWTSAKHRLGNELFRQIIS